MQASEGERQDPHNQTTLKEWRKTPFPDGDGGGATAGSHDMGESGFLAAVGDLPQTV